MDYLYKMLDETTARILYEENCISLIRPFYYFLSEGKGFNVFRMMKDKIESSTSDTSIYTDKKILSETRKWICGYKDSLPPELKKEYSCYDLKSDLDIAMTIYFQTYCGYFTTIDLCDDALRSRFIENNKGLCSSKTKFARIPIAENNLDKTCWISNVTTNEYYTYDPQQCDEETFGRIRGTLHIHEVVYSEPKNLKEPYEFFNNNDSRRISSLLKYVDNKFCNQSEKRLMFRIPSYRPNESVVSFSCKYPPMSFSLLEEQMVYTIQNICSEANKYPEYIYLTLNKYDIFDLKA